MPRLDRLKEEVAYFKFWQGVAAVTDISLTGWIITAADTAAYLTVLLAVLGVILLSTGLVVLHRRIERRIAQIGEL
jgi:hypothetical protein